MTATKPGVQGSTLQRYLGSARVVRGVGRSLVVALEDETRVFAKLALAFPYQPACDDEVLVIGDAQSFFVIGVLDGHGVTCLSGAGGLSLHAEGGRLSLVGDRGISLRGHHVAMETNKLVRLATTAVQTFGAQALEVREALSVEAGEVDELSQRSWVMQAKGVVLKALKGARMKGRAVRLG